MRQRGAAAVAGLALALAVLPPRAACAGTASGDPGRPAGAAPPAVQPAPIELAQAGGAPGRELESSSHSANGILDLKPLYLGSVMITSSSRAIAEEPRYDQSITLAEAINYVLLHGLPIKISRESLKYQRYQTFSNIAAGLPSFTMSYTMSRNNIFSADTLSIARSFLAGVSYPVFQGGAVLYGVLTQRYREKAWVYTYKTTVSDVFLDVYTKYTNLVLNRVLMQIWAKAVEVDQEQLKINEAKEKAGTGTRFAVLQSETQLASDRQSLLQQQVAVRQAALALNFALNFPMAVNLVPVEETLSEAAIFDDKVTLNEILKDAMKHSLMLRQYELFRLAAERNVQLASASLYPTVSFFTLYQAINSGVTPAQNAAAVGGVATAAIASTLNSTFAGRVTNLALGQQQGFSPTAGLTSTQGANTGPSAMPAASGGTPIAGVQSGSLVTSGAVAPSIFGGGTGAAQPNFNGSLQAPAGIFPGIFRDFIAGFALTWSLPNGAGLSTAAQINAAHRLARQALMQCNQAIDLVLQTVRSDYLAMLSARSQIDNAAYAVASSREALRLARVRLANGVGTNLEVIQTQRDYVTALTSQARAIVASSLAQAQLLHDMGMISAETLTRGYKPGAFVDPTRRLPGRLTP